MRGPLAPRGRARGEDMKTKTVKRKPDPCHCGGAAQIIMYRRPFYNILCTGTCGFAAQLRCFSVDAAVDHWNRREKAGRGGGERK